jgi:hypothetical protein
VTFALALAPVLAVIVALFLAGCGPADPAASSGATSSAPTGTSSGTPTASSGGTGGGASTGAAPKVGAVTITRTGGIAGVMQQVVISPDGSWVYTDKKTAATQQGHLTVAEAAQLARLIGDPAIMLESRSTPPPIACADSFVYTIAAGEVSLRYDQCVAQGKRPITDQLIATVVAATPL